MHFLSILPSLSISNIKYPYEKTWDKTKTNVKLEISNTNVSMMNAIRRIMISNVPTFGFRTEPYEKNEGNIYSLNLKLPLNSKFPKPTNFILNSSVPISVGKAFYFPDFGIEIETLKIVLHLGHVPSQAKWSILKISSN